MTLKHIKCNIFFTIGCLSLTLLLGCRSEQNTESKIETTSSEKSPVKKFNPNTQNNITLEIDDAALVELDQWTSFFILQKEIIKKLPVKGDIEKTVFPDYAKKGLLDTIKFKNVEWFSVDSFKDMEECSVKLEKIIK